MEKGTAHRSNPLKMKDTTLSSFWIKPTELTRPVGFGVAARSVDDAVALMTETGYSISPATVRVLRICSS